MEGQPLSLTISVTRVIPFITLDRPLSQCRHSLSRSSNYCSSAPVSPCSHKCRSHSQSATETSTFYYYLSTRSISSLRRHSFFGRLDSFVLDVPSFSCVLILAALVRRVSPFVSHSNTVHITSHHITAQHNIVFTAFDLCRWLELSGWRLTRDFR